MRTVEELEAEIASLKETVSYYVDQCTELRIALVAAQSQEKS